MNRLWVVCGLALLSGGCSTGNAPSGERSDSSSSSTAQDAPSAKTALAEFSLHPAEISRSFATVDRLAAFDRDELRAAALDGIDAVDPDARYVAVYALSLTATAESVAELAHVMVSGAPWERLLAATALAGLGDRDAVPVIIAFLSDDDSFPYWEPPTTYWKYARRQLLSMTGEDFGLSAALDSTSAAATIPAWTQWWAVNGAAFQPRPRTVRLP